MIELTEDKIKCAILNHMTNNWQKIAMVITLAADDLYVDINDDSLFVIAKNIDDLIKKGKIISIGNTENWRASEIRLAQEN